MARVKDDFPQSNTSPKTAPEFEQPSSPSRQDKKFPLPVPVLIGTVLALVICVVFAMIASNDSRKEVPTPHPPAPATATLEPTRPEPTSLPTPTVTLPPPSFSDDFDKGLSNYWAYFLALGEKNDVDISAQGEHVRFTITDYDTYAYLIYELRNYEDVRIDTEVTNQGSNNNNVGLICRFSENGWYEFNISSSGVYSIYAFDNNEYRLIRNGGSHLIRIDKDTNQYGVECIGEELTLYINDEKVWSGNDSTFTSGMVGISASTKDYQPVKVDFENITITEK
jgi:hypothetical protein